MHAIRELVEAGGLQNGSFHAMGIARPFRSRGATMPERPFKLIKLKKTPAGSVRAFPSEISTAQAAVAFVNSLDGIPYTRPSSALSARRQDAALTEAFKGGGEDMPDRGSGLCGPAICAA